MKIIPLKAKIFPHLSFKIYLPAFIDFLFKNKLIFQKRQSNKKIHR
jgi:hypothetical protein